MNSRFYVITFASLSVDENTPVVQPNYLRDFTAEMSKVINIVLDRGNRLQLTISKNDDLKACHSLAEARIEMNKNQFQLVAETKHNGEIIAFYEGYFALLPLFKLYRVETSHLFLKSTNSEYLMQSFCYGLLQELANHNAGDKTIYKRGLALLDYLYTTPPKHLCKISKRKIDSHAFALKTLKSNFHLPDNVLRQVSSSITNPDIAYINFNDIDFDVLRHALLTVGSFVLIGASMEKFKLLGATDILESAERVFNLTEGELYKVYNEAFSGYQDVQFETVARAIVDGKTEVRNSEAFHVKPNALRAPKGFDARGFVNGYAESFALQHTLYRIMAVHFKIKPQDLPNYSQDTLSVLTIRQYFETTPGTIGIPLHSDYNILSLVYANRPGLQVLNGRKWLAMPHEEVCINMGDAGLFLMKDIPFKAGLHRVLEVKETRLSFAFFLNPKKDQLLEVPNGETITYETYLKSNKLPYINKRN